MEQNIEENWPTGATEHSMKLQQRIEQIEAKLIELFEVVNEILKIIEKIK